MMENLKTNKEILEENMSKSNIQSWDYSKLEKIGYWYKPSDWKNIEFTVIFKLLDSLRSIGVQYTISLVTRSISHSVPEGKSNDMSSVLLWRIKLSQQSFK